MNEKAPIRTNRRHALRLGAALALFLASPIAAVAQGPDRLTLAVGQRGAWDTAVSELGMRAGIFEKHGLVLNILYTQGGGETQQTVISGAVDIGVGPAVMAVLGAYSKGAPVRILSAGVTGAADLYWYVRADSPVQSLAGIGGRTIAFSTTGASTNEVVKAFVAETGLAGRPTATGNPAATLTQVMSGQIDIGWATPPFGLAQLDRGDIRMIAIGNDAAQFRDQTVRLLIVNARSLQSNRDALVRYMRAYRETLDWMYESAEAIPTYAEFASIPEAMARRTRDEFFPKAALDPDRVLGLDAIMDAAIELRYIDAPLGADALAELIQIPPRN